MIEIFSFLEIMSIVVLIVNIWSLYDENEEIGNGVSSVAFVIVLVLSAICDAFVADGGYESISPLLGHIDKDKTKTSETNGEITDLWVTVDGKEYHFELKHEGENEHDK